MTESRIVSTRVVHVTSGWGNRVHYSRATTWRVDGRPDQEVFGRAYCGSQHSLRSRPRIVDAPIDCERCIAVHREERPE